MAVTFVGTTTGSANNGGNVTLTLPAARLTNDYVLVTVCVASSRAATLSVLTSASSNYTQVVATLATSSVNFGVFRRFLASTAETLATVTGTGNSSDATAATCHIFRGVSTATPEDVSATSTTGSGTTPDSPSITVANTQCGIITSIGLQLASAVPTPPSSFLNSTSAFGNDNWDAIAAAAWITNTSTAAFNPAAWTSSATTTWASATVALRPGLPPFNTWPGLAIPSDFRFEMVGY